jgi:hypothetical protein
MRFLLLYALVFCSIRLEAQFIQFSITIEPEVSAGVVQELDFGQLVLNSQLAIEPGNPNSGWFQLVVLNTAQISVEFDMPSHMILQSEPDCSEPWCRFPVELQFAYFVSDDPFDGRIRGLQPLNAVFNTIDVSPDWNSAGFSDEFRYVLINVSGSVEVGDVASGVYAGELALIVSY